MWLCPGELPERNFKDDAKIKSSPRKSNINCVYRCDSAINWQLKCVCRQSTDPRGDNQICRGRADKRWAWLVQYLRRIRVSRTTCYSAGKGEEVTGINSLWLKKLPRLLQWITRRNVAEKLATPCLCSSLIMRRSKWLIYPAFGLWILFEHFCVSRIVKMKS